MDTSEDARAWGFHVDVRFENREDEMADEARPLTEEERAELEELRAQKARCEREELERLRAEMSSPKTPGEGQGEHPGEGNHVGKRARDARETVNPNPEPEPEPDLFEDGGQPSGPHARRARTVSAEEARQIEHDREVRERNARLMEPDDDLRMPVGQKVVLVAIIAVAIVALLAMAFGPR